MSKKTIIITENQAKKLRDLTLLKGKVNSGLMTIGEIKEKRDENKPHSINYTEKDYMKAFKEIAKFMQENGLKVLPMPKISLRHDKQSNDPIENKTGYYNPEFKEVVVFINGRHPKDVLRSFAHEMIHHAQNLRGDNLNFSTKDEVKNSKKLEKIESEAYLKGNIFFRKWTEKKMEDKKKKSKSENLNEEFIVTKKQMNILSEEISQEKKAKPYTINPDKVLIVKKYLDSNFKRGKIEKVGDNGYPEIIPVIAMLGSDMEVLKNFSMEQCQDLLIDKYKKMFYDEDEKTKFFAQVLKDWYYDKISQFGTLSVTHL